MALLIKKPTEYGNAQSLYETGLNEDILVIGLGNPGGKYRRQRHNVGWRCLEAWAEKQQVGWQKRADLKAEVATVHLNNCRVRLLKPQTFVNLSGQALAAASQYFKITAEQIWVVYDEARLNWGRLGVVIDEPLGSHNGLASVAQHNSQVPPLPRIQIGIGPQPKDWDRTDFVLSDFLDREEAAMPTVLTAAGELIAEAAGGQLRPGQHQVLTALDQNS